MDELLVERARRRILMQKFLLAALAATGLALAAISVAAPVAPIGKAADVINGRSNSSLVWLLLSPPSSSLLVALRPQDLPLVMGRDQEPLSVWLGGSFFFEITPQSVRAKFKRLM
jgi:hypothetical protein